MLNMPLNYHFLLISILFANFIIVNLRLLLSLTPLLFLFFYELKIKLMETIMVQEPDAATLETITFALQMKGFRVCNMSDQHENILETISRQHPGLVLLDLWSGNFSGRQIGQWIKAHFPKLPVIALSGDSQIDAQYQLLGFNDYIKKPFNLELLNRVVRKNLRRRRTRKYTLIPDSDAGS